jgi:hypothetical protein
MLPDKDIGCHHTGFARKCRELVASGECNRFIQIEGTNPQTKETFNRWDCVDNWAPLLLIDNARQQAQTCASIDRFNNDMVHMNRISAAVQGMAPALSPAESIRLIGEQHHNDRDNQRGDPPADHPPQND